MDRQPITIIQIIRSAIAIIIIIAIYTLTDKYIEHMIQQDKESLEFDQRTWEKNREELYK